MKQNYVAQKDEMGCGVACVANRLGISYAEALKLFEHPEHAKTIGYKCKYIVAALRHSGLDVRLRYIGRHNDDEIESISDGAIVLLRKSEKYPYQHYLMKCATGWVDPWINMHDVADVQHARADIRHTLPGEPYYAIF